MSACGIRAAHTDCLGVGVPPRGLRALQGAGECRFLRLRTGSSTGALGLRLEADVFVRVRDSGQQTISVLHLPVILLFLL